jgi:succinate-semialdehyde dehydrogenase/glutarate-semialdehyde dehydrogenase
MMKVRDILLDNVDEYASLIALEVGKPIGQAVGEVKKSAGHCQYYIDNSSKFL